VKETLLNTFSGKTILITGNTGFKGSWLTVLLEHCGARVIGLALDPLPDSLYCLGDFRPKFKEIRSDITNRHTLETELSKMSFDLVIHLAAQPLVSRAYLDPLSTFEVNTLGLANLVYLASLKETCKGVVVVTTDKVYEPSKSIKGHLENDKLGGIDPYSASKSAAEMLLTGIRSALSNTDCKLVSVRAGNVIGGGDLSTDRLLPDLIKSFKNHKDIVIRNPDFVRPWIHVLDALYGYLLVGEKILNGIAIENAYNFGPTPRDLKTVGEVAILSKEYWGEAKEIVYEPSEMIEDNYLALDSRKARAELNWNNLLNSDEAIEVTIKWWKEFLKGESPRMLVEGDIRKYLFSDM